MGICLRGKNRHSHIRCTVTLQKATQKNRNQKYFPILHCAVCYRCRYRILLFIGENFMPWKMLGESNVQ